MAQKDNIIFMFQVIALLNLERLGFCIRPNQNVNITTVNTSPDTSSIFTSTDKAGRHETFRKWQVGRVSRKHYEIVNMIWRKTKIFADVEITSPTENRIKRSSFRTANNKELIKPLTYVTKGSLLPPSTMSYIEFYYLDDNDERVKRRDSFLPKFKNSLRMQLHTDDNIFLKSPVLSFHINDNKRSLLTAKPKTTENLRHRKQKFNEKPSVYEFFKIGYGSMIKPKPKNNLNTIYTTINTATCPSTTIETFPMDYHNATNPSTVKLHNDIEEVVIDSEQTTVYDRIKFFEMYDDHTARPSNNDIISNSDDNENMIKDNEIVQNQKEHLEDIHRNIGHDSKKKVKNVKKHIVPASSTARVSKQTTKIKSKFESVKFTVNKTLAELRNNSRRIHKNSSRVALWSDYPFAAVYVYEPSQIHCDAAALSPHWIVAAGSCLSRFHNKDPETEGRSAFVAYCGQNWWQPERVSYVKYSIVHPSFHPKDKTRKYLYNIGLVQVVGSMSSCSGWAPIVLMSHHFAANPDGSKSTAVGWGLDRYDIRYSPVVLPKRPLSAFESLVHSESCPGSSTFAKEKLINEEGSIVKNVYCLSLPPYFGEQNDPVHGSLLLVGGKLIALYLQEERRIFGEQSAQYTGVWRLVPWVHEVAREPDEADGLSVDI